MNEDERAKFWEYHLNSWEDDFFVEAHKEWTKWLRRCEEHKEHPKTVKCKGCDRKYCRHLDDWVCTSFPTCAQCDQTIQPNPFNPINRCFVKRYAPQRFLLMVQIEDRRVQAFKQKVAVRKIIKHWKTYWLVPDKTGYAPCMKHYWKEAADLGVLNC